MDDLMEKLADIEHQRWAGWMKHLFSKCEIDAEQNFVIPASWCSRWQKQIDTPYANLSEAEKESDRREVRNSLRVIRDAGPNHLTIEFEILDRGKL